MPEIVVSVVLKCINYIRSGALQYRLFRDLLEKMKAVHGDVLYFTEVCWLSRGSVLKRFFDLRGNQSFHEGGKIACFYA